ncbi:hypothetical protein FRC12_005101 [Ceratobasidium sp. 428]|nr:hypothetical protein FRC12_005101 [Ceratobasidium sp. 428]
MRDFTREISSLAILFTPLPDSLPLNPPSSHLEFGLDQDFVQDEGWGAAFNQRMEVTWRSWQGPICIQERGLRLECCIQLLRQANNNITNDSERGMWLGGWLDKLSQAAINSGATIQSNTTESSTECIILSDADDAVENVAAPTALTLPTPSIPKAPPQPPQLLNGKLNFQKIPRELALAQSAERAKTLASQHEYRMAAKAERAEQEKTRKREEEHVRKAAWRERKKAKEIQTGKRDADGKLISSTDKPSDTAVTSDDEVTAAAIQALQTGRSQAHNERLMRQKKPLKIVKKRICWQGPATWVHILAAVKAEGIEYARKHPTAVVKRLKLTHRDTRIFNKLHESVVGRWFTTNDEGRACWKPMVLLRALKESGLGGGGRSKKLVCTESSEFQSLTHARVSRHNTQPF